MIYGDAVAIDGGEISLDVRIDGGELGVVMPLYPEAYAGPTTVIPNEETQTLETAGLMVAENITVEPIPSNYGRIAYNGTTLLVY